MSRHRDYQPTIDRAHGQLEVFKRRESKLRGQKDECHREMLRAVAAARIANEEADALRDRITGLEQSVRDLRQQNSVLRFERDANASKIVTLTKGLEKITDWLETPLWRRLVARARRAFNDMLKIGAEA